MQGGKQRFGPVQQKILLVLLGGVALACTRSPTKQWRIVKEMHESWKDIGKQAAERAITALYDLKLLEMRKNTDGTTTLVLNEGGRKRALTYRIHCTKIKHTGLWDRKWRIVLYDIPEDEREARDAFREHLTTLGFHKLQQSAGIFPFDCKSEVEFFIEVLGIRKFVRFVVADSIDDGVYWKSKFKLNIAI